MYPENFRYTKEHEWVSVDGDIGTVGITDHAQSELGDIVYVDLPKVGTHLDQGKSLGSVESVKAVSDIYSPVGGEVIEINQALADAPGEAEYRSAWRRVAGEDQTDRSAAGSESNVRRRLSKLYRS